MASGAAPDALSERHKIIAEMESAGATDVEIAHRIGISASRISIIRTSPLYQALVLDLSKERRSKSTFDIAKAIDDLAPRALGRLAELIDQDENLGVALGATNAIMDRVSPKKTINEVDQTVRVRLSLEQVDAMRRAAAEDSGALEIEAPPPGLKALDDAIAEAAAREAAVEPIEEAEEAAA